MTIAARSSVDTVYSACSVEFCPAQSNVFACGTYQIEKEEAVQPIAPPPPAATREDGSDDDHDELPRVEPVVTRYGRCLLYNIDQDGTNLREIQRFDGPAILDMKWSPKPWNHSSTLAIADAKGGVQLHALDAENNRLQQVQRLECADDKTLALSLDWSNRLASNTSQPSIVVSLSDGSVSHLEGESELSVTSNWHAHDFEPWIAAFDCWTPTTVWTGGDDCKMKGWDLRQGCDQPTFVNKRFDGGVTTIQSHPLLENIFAVGSYDSTVRIFDRRKPQVPLISHDAGGGIWRLKWHPTLPHRLLIAAMHDGFKVIDFANLVADEEGGAKESTLWARFDEHESLAYGVDWCGITSAQGEDVVASCSFYDHSLKVWAC